MKRILIPALGLLCMGFTACNNADKKKDDHSGITTETPKTTTDRLMADVRDGHNIGMAKMSKLSNMQNAVQQVLDSIAALPAKAQQAADPYKRNLNGMLEDLKSAKDDMNKWMEEFNMDSAVNDLQQRIKYLTEEKLKITKVKESILSTLQKADSLIKAKF